MAIDYSKAKNKDTDFGGTKGILLPSGTTAERVDETPRLRYNSDTGLSEIYAASGWQPLDAPPVVTTITPTTFDGTAGTTITVNGSNFKSGSTVKFISNGGTEYNAATTTFVNSAQVTATTPQAFLVADEPFDVRVVNPSGLAATLEDALDCGGAPSWTTASGNLADVSEGGAISTSSLSATDPEGGAITYSETNATGTASASVLSGAGLSVNSGTGVITGTAPSGISGDTTYNFYLSASDPQGNKTPRAFNIIVRDIVAVEFKLWGAGGGSGSQNRSNSSYHTNTFYGIKEGGAGGFVSGTYQFNAGTTLLFSVGGGGIGGLISGNPSSASGGFSGGGNSTYSGNDAGGGGGGYTGVFLNSSGKNQSGAILIAPGGGGGAGGPGYPSNGDDRANGGGGIQDANGVGNRGERNLGYFEQYAFGGTPTAGGAGGLASSGADSHGGGDGSAGGVLAGGNAVFYGGSNSWGSGGGGGGGFFGGGSGCNDGNSWSGGGGASGSAFARGSGITYNAAGNSSLAGVTYVSHTFTTQSFQRWGDGTNTSYGSMRGPAGTGDSQYPGSNIGYGGAFNTSPANGITGNNGVLLYRIDGGSWQTVNYTGSNTTITL